MIPEKPTRAKTFKIQNPVIQKFQFKTLIKKLA